MKLAYLIANFPLLSETFVAHEIARLRRRGCEVHILAFGVPPAADVERLEPLSRELRGATQYVTLLDGLLATTTQVFEAARSMGAARALRTAATLKCNSILMLLRAAAVARIMKQRGIRHVHAHWPYASQVAHLARQIAGVSYSISVHAHEVAHDNGHFPLIFRELSFAAFCNRGAMEYLLARIDGAARSRAHLVYHGVDLSGFRSLPWPSTVRPLHVISAGRLTRTKGFDRLIRACAAARDAGVDVRLTLLGRGSCEPQLRELAHELRFEEFLSMPGWVPHHEVTSYLQGAHVFALLADTSFHDGLPNVVLEAMASGRPVILSALPAAQEAVRDGSEGFIVQDLEDPTPVVRILRRLQTEAGLLERLGAAARRRVEADHDAEAQIENMVALFARCTGVGT